MTKFRPKFGHITENRRNWHLREMNNLISHINSYESILKIPKSRKIRTRSEIRAIKRQLRKSNKELEQRRAELARFDKQQIRGEI